MGITLNTRHRYYSSPRYPAKKGGCFPTTTEKRIREQYHLHLASTLLANGKKVKEMNLIDWLLRSICTFWLEKRYERVFYSWWWLGLLVRGIKPCDWARYQRHAAVSQREREGEVSIPSQCWAVELCVRYSGCKDVWGEAFSSVCRDQCSFQLHVPSDWAAVDIFFGLFKCFSSDHSSISSETSAGSTCQALK